MGVQSLSELKLQRARRLAQYEAVSPSSVLPSPPSPSVAYPPIFLPPSDFIDPSPAPSFSPLPAAAAGGSHQLPTAAIVGGSVASVVALAATTTIIATVAGKAGLSCALGPLLKLLACLGEKLMGPSCGKRFESLCSTLKKWRPRRKRRKSDAAADDNEGSADCDAVDLVYEILGGSPSRASQAHSLTTSPAHPKKEQLQITSGQAYLVTTASDYLELEMKKKEEEMLRPLRQRVAAAQGYAESLVSVADNAIQDLKPVTDEVGMFKAKANYVMASADQAFAAIQNHPGEIALSMFNEVITAEVDGEKSARLQAGPVLLEEEVVLDQRRGKRAKTHPRILGADESKEQEELLDEEGGKSGQHGYVVKSASDASTKLQVLEEKPGAPAAPHKQNTSGAASGASRHSLALVSTSETGGITAKNKAGMGAIIPMPTKAIVPTQSKTMVTTTKSKREGNGASKNKRKRPSTLGHVSFSCEMSAQRLRFFTSCKTGGTYGSPMVSPDNTPTNTINTNRDQIHTSHNDGNATKISSSNSYEPNSVPYQLYVPFHDASHYNPMHQQVYHPSQRMLVQHNVRNVSPPSMQQTTSLPTNSMEVIDNNFPSQNRSRSLDIDDYGGPFDGVL